MKAFWFPEIKNRRIAAAFYLARACAWENANPANLIQSEID